MAIGEIMVATALFVMLTAFAVLALYLLGAIGLYGMGEKAGVEYSWLAFIPIFNLYVVGKIIRKLRFFGVTIQHPEFFLPLAVIVVSAFSYTPFLVTKLVLSLLLSVLLIFAVYDLIKLYRRERAKLYTVLSILIPVFYTILLFALRNEVPQYEEHDMDSYYDSYDYYN